LHSNDEHRPTPGRPSPDSTEQKIEVDRLRLLGANGDKDDLDSYPKSGFGKLSWAVTCALLLALAAGGVLWSGEEGAKQIVLAGTEPPPAELPTLAEEDPTETDPTYGSHVTVLQDEPAAELKPAPVEAKAPSEARNLKLLTPKRVVKPAAARSKPTNPKAVKAVQRTKPAAKSSTRRKSEAVRTVAAPVPAPDKDVALLSALMEHSKATTQPKPSALALNLKQCRALKKAAEAKRCIAKLCTGSAKGKSECRS